LAGSAGTSDAISGVAQPNWLEFFTQLPLVVLKSVCGWQILGWRKTGGRGDVDGWIAGGGGLIYNLLT
jgi:hypothetical protein